jgi:membrane protein DedA with SNARE-associated domain
MASGAAELLAHWSYGAIFVAVILGNIGFPVPEETILVLGGYMAQRGALRLDIVMAIGIVSAVSGDGIGYWLGRR